MKRIFDSKEETLNRENVYYWMNKYISLLEKYNELLLRQAGSDDKARLTEQADQNYQSANQVALKKSK